MDVTHRFPAKSLDFYLTALLAKYQRWLVESPAKMEIRLDNAGNMMKEMVARQVRDLFVFAVSFFFFFFRNCTYS